MSEDKQAYVFGDAIRTIYDLQLGQYAGEEGVNTPARIVIFIDELNKYASKETPKGSLFVQSKRFLTRLKVRLVEEQSFLKRHLAEMLMSL